MALARPDGALAAWLAPAMPLQAIVVHAGLLLGLAVFAWPSTRRGHLAWWPLVVLLATIYIRAALGTGGPGMLVQFLLLMAATYGGVLWASRATRTAVAVETALRWLIGGVGITLAFGVSGAPSIEEWTDVRSRLVAGAFYFGVLAAIESTGLYLALRRVKPA